MLTDNIKWASFMEAMYSLPPDPLFTENWLELWRNRLENLQPLSEEWLKHHNRDYYWKQGSICEDYSKVKAATFLIGGFADGYTNTVKRTFDNLSCPKRAIVGPWVHLYPHIAVPEPQWGFCTEAIKWWDQWLKEETVPEAPAFVTFLQDEMKVPCQESVQGRWVMNAQTKPKTFYMSNDGLGEKKGDGVVDITTNQTCGIRTDYFYTTALHHMPREQTRDDTLSQVFESKPLEMVTEYLGYPVVKLAVASDTPIANGFLRLCVVDTTGNSRLIAYTAFNLNHDKSHESVTPLEPGKFKKVEVTLDYIGETIRPGHRLRLCVSTALFPMFVPNAENVTLSLDLSKCQLDMPMLVESERMAGDIPKVTDCKALDTVTLTPGHHSVVEGEDEEGRSTLCKTTYSGKKEYVAHGLITEYTEEEMNAIRADNPTSAIVKLSFQHQW